MSALKWVSRKPGAEHPPDTTSAGHQGVTGRGRSFCRGGFETRPYERNVLRTCCALMARRLPASIQLQGAEDATRDLLVAGLDPLPVLLTALVVRGQRLLYQQHGSLLTTQLDLTRRL